METGIVQQKLFGCSGKMWCSQCTSFWLKTPTRPQCPVCVPICTLHSPRYTAAVRLWSQKQRETSVKEKDESAHGGEQDHITFLQKRMSSKTRSEALLTSGICLHFTIRLLKRYNRPLEDFKWKKHISFGTRWVTFLSTALIMSNLTMI